MYYKWRLLIIIVFFLYDIDNRDRKKFSILCEIFSFVDTVKEMVKWTLCSLSTLLYVMRIMYVHFYVKFFINP